MEIFFILEVHHSSKIFFINKTVFGWSFAKKQNTVS
jgi:hypothetical protein